MNFVSVITIIVCIHLNKKDRKKADLELIRKEANLEKLPPIEKEGKESKA